MAVRGTYGDPSLGPAAQLPPAVSTACADFLAVLLQGCCLGSPPSRIALILATLDGSLARGKEICLFLSLFFLYHHRLMESWSGIFISM